MFGGAWTEPTFNMTQRESLLIGVEPFSAKSTAPGVPLGNIGVTQDLSELGLPATARGAAVRAVQWCHDRQVEMYREPVGDRIRDAEALEWQIGPRITVSEVGFDGGNGRVFETASLPGLPARRICLAI